MGTHDLGMAEGGTCQDKERKRLSEGHSLPRDDRGKDFLLHRENATERGALTNWRGQKDDGPVRTRKDGH